MNIDINILTDLIKYGMDSNKTKIIQLVNDFISNNNYSEAIIKKLKKNYVSEYQSELLEVNSW